MNKKITALALSGLIIGSTQLNSESRPAFMRSYITGIAHKIDLLVDMKPKHWAYNAVKYVVEDLNIMEPKTPTRFMGDKTATRYELARAFYNGAKGLEDISEKDLRLSQATLEDTLTDVNEDNKKVVNSIVNEYSIMQLMPDNRFMGNREMTRYELAFDMNNYLMLLEKKINVPEVAPRDRLSQLTDIPADHWAYNAVKNIVDKYKIMDGYPQGVFGGDQKLTRYEVAALIKKFIEYVDKNVLSIKPTPVPTPIPTPEPTPTPVPTPEPTPTPIPKEPAKMLDIKAGLVANSLINPSSNNSFYMIDPGIDLNADIWFGAFGIGLNSRYLLGDDKLTNTSGNTFVTTNRINAGLTANYKILGTASAEDPSLYLGLGYNFINWNGNVNGNGHGVGARLGFEYPINKWFGLRLEDNFNYYLAGTTGWKNDVFAGFTLPAYSMFAMELGYTGSLYSISGISSFNNQNGIQLNLRYRY